MEVLMRYHLVTSGTMRSSLTILSPRAASTCFPRGSSTLIRLQKTPLTPSRALGCAAQTTGRRQGDLGVVRRESGHVQRAHFRLRRVRVGSVGDVVGEGPGTPTPQPHPPRAPHAWNLTVAYQRRVWPPKPPAPPPPPQVDPLPVPPPYPP